MPVPSKSAAVTPIGRAKPTERRPGGPRSISKPDTDATLTDGSFVRPARTPSSCSSSTLTRNPVCWRRKGALRFLQAVPARVSKLLRLARVPSRSPVQLHHGPQGHGQLYEAQHVHCLGRYDHPVLTHALDISLEAWIRKHAAYPCRCRWTASVQDRAFQASLGAARCSAVHKCRTTGLSASVSRPAVLAQFCQ